MKKIFKNKWFIIVLLLIFIILISGYFNSYRVKKIKNDCIDYSLNEMVDNLGPEFIIAMSPPFALPADWPPPSEDYQKNVGRLDEIRSRFYHFCLKIKGIESFEQWLRRDWEGEEEMIDYFKNENFKFWMNQ